MAVQHASAYNRGMTQSHTMTPAATPQTVYAQGQALQPGVDLAELRSSSADLPIEELRRRLDDDGYLLLRGFHPHDDVLAARHEICLALQRSGCLEDGTAVDDAVSKKNAPGLNMTRETNQPFPRYIEMVSGQRRLDFFSRLFDSPAMTLDHKWLRTVMPGTKGTAAHCDVVYMGAGSKRLHTVWTPIGDVDYHQGPLMLLPGSHRCQNIVDSYGQSNSHNGTPGSFSRDIKTTAAITGCTWASTAFEAGDILIFGMWLMHASLENASKSFRISTDNRYQPANEPLDQRHMGKLNLSPTPGEWLAECGQELLQN